jgi:hypothetical protein
LLQNGKRASCGAKTINHHDGTIAVLEVGLTRDSVASQCEAYDCGPILSPTREPAELALDMRNSHLGLSVTNLTRHGKKWRGSVFLERKLVAADRNLVARMEHAFINFSTVDVHTIGAFEVDENIMLVVLIDCGVLT